MSIYGGDVQILQTLTTHTSDVNAVDFAGDSILVTGSGLVPLAKYLYR